MDPISKSQFQVDILELFSNIPDLMDVNSKILQDLEDIKRGTGETVGSIFLKFVFIYNSVGQH